MQAGRAKERAAERQAGTYVELHARGCGALWLRHCVFRCPDLWQRPLHSTAVQPDHKQYPEAVPPPHLVQRHQLRVPPRCLERCLARLQVNTVWALHKPVCKCVWGRGGGGVGDRRAVGDARRKGGRLSGGNQKGGSVVAVAVALAEHHIEAGQGWSAHAL